MDTQGWAALLGQLGFAAAAYRLASQLKIRVDNHETRLGTLEKKKKR